MSPETGTAACLRRDRERLRRWREAQGLAGGWLALDPSYQAVWLHRASARLSEGGWRLAARFLWHLNVLLTGADISPCSRFGAGLLIRYPSTIVMVCTAGRDLTVGPQVVVGGGVSRADIGAGPGLPVLGNGVELEAGALVLGPVNVGDGARIGPRCVVNANVPAGGCVQPEPALLRPARAERTAQWAA